MFSLYYSIIFSWIGISSFVHGQDEIYSFDPKSRHLDVNPYGSDRVSFYPLKDSVFGACYFKCDVFSGMYHLYDNYTDMPDETHQLFPPYFLPAYKTGSCAFTILRWTKDVPRYWEIAVFDNTTSQNYTEQRIINPEGVKLTKCQILYYTSEGVNTTVDFDMNSYKASFVPDDPELNSRMSSVGNGFCGYKMINAQKTDPSIVFIVTDENDEQYRQENAKVTVVDLDETYENRTLSALVGSPITINCGPPATDHEIPQKLCLLYNPQEELVLEDVTCGYDIRVVTKEDYGTWKCSIGHDGSMEILEFTTELVEKEKEKVEVYAEDKGATFNIGCKLVNYDNPSINYCVFTRPDSEDLLINLGSATDRYTSLTSDFDQGICGLEISKPLLLEEKGTWKCALDIGAYGKTGGYITVEKETSIPHKQHSKLIVNLGDTFTIDCQVPFNSEFCYITSPNGSRHRPNQAASLSFGRCSLTVKEAEIQDDGDWSCHFAQATGLPAISVQVELAIADVKLVYADSEAEEGEDVELVCNTAGVPIEYCIFISPQLESFYLTKSESKSSKYSYFGKGIGYGDCGIRINGATNQDGGKWTCYISVGFTEKTEMTGEIQLAVNQKSTPLGTADSLGIALGVLAAAIIIAGVIFYRRHKGRTTDQSPEEMQPRGSNDSRSGIMGGNARTVYDGTVL